MEEKTYYTCPICGKSYSDPVEMADCIKRCDAKRKEYARQEEEKVRESKRAEARKKVEDAYKVYRNTIDEYNKTFGCSYRPITMFYDGKIYEDIDDLYRAAKGDNAVDNILHSYRTIFGI